jgi:hypothetical protein
LLIDILFLLLFMVSRTLPIFTMIIIITFDLVLLMMIIYG